MKENVRVDIEAEINTEKRKKNTKTPFKSYICIVWLFDHTLIENKRKKILFQGWEQTDWLILGDMTVLVYFAYMHEQMIYSFSLSMFIGCSRSIVSNHGVQSTVWNWVWRLWDPFYLCSHLKMIALVERRKNEWNGKRNIEQM